MRTREETERCWAAAAARSFSRSGALMETPSMSQREGRGFLWVCFMV